MAWKDPFETLVDNTVADFADFLARQETLAPNEQARAQEVCRDFCVYLCKDIHKATPQDYAIYLQLHAMTSEAESDYKRMLGYIHSFTEQVKQKHTPAAALPINPRPARKNLGTLQFEPSAELLNDLFNTKTSLDSLSTSEEVEHFKPSDPAATPERPLPPQLDPYAVNALNYQAQNSISEGLEQFDFSIDEGLMGAVFDEKDKKEETFKNLRQHSASSAEYVPSTYPSTIDAFENLPNDDKSIFSPESFLLNEDEHHAKIQNRGEYSQERNSSQHASLRVASELTYQSEDFEHIRKMAQRKEEPALIAAKPQSLGFKPYTLNGRYRIEYPLPKPQDYQPVKRKLLQSYFYPLAPAIITTAIAAAIATISLGIAAIILVFTLVLIAIAIPDLGRPPQQTPHASIASYLAAQRGRCYNIAHALIAKKQDDPCPDIHEIWEDKVPSAATAIVERFKRQKLPDIQTVAGSDKQNTLILLYENDTSYHVIPLVRIDGRWYICEAELPEYKLDDD